MGIHRLKDLIRPQHILKVVTPGLPADFPAPRTLDSLPNNLPLQLTTFVGRERQIGEIKESLRHSRLGTLTGAAGSGKTRLALQAAAHVIGEFTDGVWFVDLAPLSHPSFVPQAIAEAMPRRQTLRAAVDWSWELLLENERNLLRRLSVFAIGRDRECHA